MISVTKMLLINKVISPYYFTKQLLMNTNGNTLAIPVKTDAGKKLQATLSEDRTLEAMDRLLARMDSLDKMVADLSELIQQGPGFVAMAADMVDDAYVKADAAGVNIEERLQNALHLAEKLTAPAMMEKLDSLLKVADQAPGLMAMKVDALDDIYQSADARGVNLDERLRIALQLAERLTAPEMVEKLDAALNLADQMPGLVAMKVDMIDDAWQRADAAGVNIEERLGNALQLAEKITAPEMVEKMDMLLKLSEQLPGLIAMGADIFDEEMRKAGENGYDPKNLFAVARTANHALTKAQAEPPAKVGGLFGILRVLKDPDRQRGLGFLMNFLKHFGRDF